MSHASTGNFGIPVIGMDAGYHEARLEAADRASGVDFYRLRDDT